MAKVHNDLEVEIHNNRFEALKNQFRQNDFIDYYCNVTLSNKAKKLISNSCCIAKSLLTIHHGIHLWVI